MQFLSWFSVLALVFVVAAKEPPTELKIDTTYKPADCSAKAEKGDHIKVHYVSSYSSVYRYWEADALLRRRERCSRMARSLTPGMVYSERAPVSSPLTRLRSVDRGQPFALQRACTVFVSIDIV